MNLVPLGNVVAALVFAFIEYSSSSSRHRDGQAHALSSLKEIVQEHNTRSPSWSAPFSRHLHHHCCRDPLAYGHAWYSFPCCWSRLAA